MQRLIQTGHASAPGSTVNQPPKTGNVTNYILVAFTLLIVAVLVWRIADVFVVAFGGIIFATVLRAIALPLSRATRLSPRWSVVIVVFGLLAVGSLLAWLFGSQAARQITELPQQLPQAAAKFEAWLQQSQLGRSIDESFRHAAVDSKTLANLGLAATALVRGATGLLLILFLGVHFALDPRLYRDSALRVIPPAYRQRVGPALDDAGVALQKWLLGQLIAMLSVGILIGVSLWLLGVPLALSLGILAGLCEFVPVVGPILSAIPGVLLAFSQGPEMALYAVLIYVVMQQLESNLIIPLIQRWAVKLAPAASLLAVVAFGLLFGILGVAFATPIAVVVMVMVKHLYVEDALENGAAGAQKTH
jgi:predicted PurR-regulated permease PerM